MIIYFQVHETKKTQTFGLKPTKISQRFGGEDLEIMTALYHTKAVYSHWREVSADQIANKQMYIIVKDGLKSAIK